MTEDDTFDKLRRLSYSQLLDLFVSLPDIRKRETLVNEETRDTWLKSHGWTLEEYRKNMHL